MAKNYNLTNQEIQNTFEQLAQVSSSIENGVSGYAVTDGTGSKVDLLNVSASYALTASFAQNAAGADTGSLLVTSSAVNDTITFTKGDGTTYTNVINNVSSSLSSEEIFVTAKNVQGVSIPKGYAVHSAGVTGENVNITTASYLDSSLMPAIGITQTAINAGAAGEVIISGRLKNVNTSNLVAGSPVYVNGEGALTATKPTGSALIQNIGVCAKVNATEGEIIVMGAGRSNDVPNISPGYAWVGNSDSVATAVATSSFYVTNAISASYAISASHEIIKEVSSSFADTASYVNPLEQNVDINGNLTVSGSNADQFLFGRVVPGDIGSSTEGMFLTSSGTSFLKGNIDFDGALAYSGFGTTFANDNFTVESNNSPEFKTGMRLTGSLNHTGSSSQVGSAKITGSLIVSQSGLSSGDDVFVLGAPRTGGNSLQGVIRSTVDDGLHFYGNKNFTNGANTFGGGVNYFESETQFGSAGPSTVIFQNNTGITGSSGTLPISGVLDVDGGSGVHRITGSFENSGYLWTKGFGYSDGSWTAGFDGSGAFVINNINNNGNQFGTYSAKTNTNAFPGNVYQGFQLLDHSSTGSYRDSAWEISTYTGLDSSWPVISLAMGPDNGASQNRVMWTSKNYPWMQFGKQVNFLSPVTASAAISASAGIIANSITVDSLDVSGSTVHSGSFDLEGDLDLNGALLIGDRTPSQNGYIKWDADLTNDTGIYKNDAGGGQAGGLEFRNVKTLRFVDYNAGTTNDNAGTITNEFDATNGNILEISPYHRLHVRDLGNNARFDVEIPTNITGSVDITGSLTANLEEISTTGLYAIPTISGSGRQKKFVDVKWAPRVDAALGTTNFGGVNNAPFAPAIQVTGSTSTTGPILGGTNIFAGYNGSGAVKVGRDGVGNQFPTMALNANTTTYSTNTFAGLAIVDANATGSKQNDSFELSSFTGLDGTWPVSRIQMGPNNGVNENTIVWTSENYPWANFAKQSNFQSPVTASADVMVSASKVLELQPVGTLNATAPTGSLQVSSSGEIFLWTGGAGAASGVPGWGKLTVTN